VSSGVGDITENDMSLLDLKRQLRKKED